MYIGEKPRKGLSKFVAVLTALAIASASLLAVPAYAAESGAENQNPVMEFFGNIADGAAQLFGFGDDGVETYAVENADTVVDPNTTNVWSDIATSSKDTQNVGRIWTDKSVFNDDYSFEGTLQGQSISTGDSDFLVGLSAMSSTSNVRSMVTRTQPLDIVLIIYFPDFVNTPEELVFQFRILLGATAVFIIFTFFNTIANNIFITKSRFDCLQITKLLGRVAFMFIAWALMKIFGNPLLMMSISVLAVTPVVFMASLVLAKRVWRQMNIEFSLPEKKLLKEVLSFGGQWFVITLSGILIYSSIDVMLGRYAGIAAVTLFSVPLMIGNQILSIVSSISAPAFSSLVKLGVEDKINEIAGLYRTIIEVSALIFISFFVPIFTHMRPLLTIWINPDFSGLTWVANAVLIGYFYVVFESASQTLLKATGKIGRVSQYYIYIAVIMLAAIFCILRFTDYGLAGVAVALSAFSIFRSFLILRNTARQFGADYKSIAGFTLSRMAAAAAPSGAISLLFLHIARPSTLAGLLLGMAFSFTVTFALSYMLVLKNEQRAYVKAIFKSRLAKLPNIFSSKRA